MLGEILGGAGALASLFGGSKGGKSSAPEVKSPWESLPQEMKDAYLKEYLPAAQEGFKQPFPAAPKSRAIDPSTDPFASKALWEIQQMRDAEAFNQSRNPAKPEEPKKAQQGMGGDEMFGRALMAASQNNRGGMGMAPVYSQTIGGGKKFPTYANPQNSADYGLLGRAGAYQQDNPMSDWRADSSAYSQVMGGGQPSSIMSGSLGLSPNYLPTQNPQEDPLMQLRAKLGG